MAASPVGRGGRKLPAPTRKPVTGKGPAAVLQSAVTVTGLPTDPAQATLAIGAPDASDHARATLRMHVEAALIGIFGQKVVLVPRFQGIVSQAVEALIAEPALQTVVRAACEELNKQGKPA
jgi:hypothetical protein